MKKEKSAAFSHAKTAPPVDAAGKVRVYIDLPADLARKFNVLAAMKNKRKRVLLAELVADAIAAAKI